MANPTDDHINSHYPNWITASSPSPAPMGVDTAAQTRSRWDSVHTSQAVELEALNPSTLREKGCLGTFHGCQPAAWDSTLKMNPPRAPEGPGEGASAESLSLCTDPTVGGWGSWLGCPWPHTCPPPPSCRWCSCCHCRTAVAPRR